MENFVLFGLEIGIDCEIGPGLYFPHTSGTVIGAKRIGANAVIYHNVTVGAKSPDLAYDVNVRPEIGDDAFLGAGAKIIGPIVLGNSVVVAANCVVVHSIPANSRVTGIPGKPSPKKPAVPD
ncbi:MAG: DapH/DapD/GlmU-related protein [Candidatus Aminicenantes bacterium]|nr:DapH/DapD/GlmU-related protein [Candidatus Aminicenantes bacterium]